jgi:hypothetical protein
MAAAAVNDLFHARIDLIVLIDELQQFGQIALMPQKQSVEFVTHSLGPS